MNELALRRACVWSGAVAIVLFFCGFLLAGFIPPPSPSRTTEEVVNHYQTHANGIRLGMVTMMISGMFMAPFVGEISAHLRQMPGVPAGLRYAQISAGTANAMFFFIPAIIFVITAYRPDRNPDITYFLNDFGWIIAVLPWPPAFIQSIVIAFAIFADSSPNPRFPRWLAFLNIWVALAFIPGGLLPFFKSGPLAWNGLLVFWLAGTVFVIWFVAMVVCLLKALGKETQQVGT